ncbi:hypothetical protein PISMIDRAFT_566316 [Pisolithus microcarpus 441]|uniref:Uncharacterized protein n=1 Tax=Pisolithus microcarpus 441 TaxID=765257 RepID=A0A0C9ZF93_9AGAM|nr:hypothetical protein PISMIDRAFT_566316 [Pisolithus microcarpus 441]
MCSYEYHSARFAMNLKGSATITPTATQRLEHAIRTHKSRYLFHPVGDTFSASRKMCRDPLAPARTPCKWVPLLQKQGRGAALQAKQNKRTRSISKARRSTEFPDAH